MLILDDNHFKEKLDQIVIIIEDLENENKLIQDASKKDNDKKVLDQCKKLHGDINANINKLQGKPIGINFFTRLSLTFDFDNTMTSDLSKFLLHLELLRDLSSMVSMMNFPSQNEFEIKPQLKINSLHRTTIMVVFAMGIILVFLAIGSYLIFKSVSVFLLFCLIEIPVLYFIYKFFQTFYASFLQINYLNFINNGVKYLSKSPLGVQSKSEKIVEQSISELLKSLPNFKDSSKKTF